MARAEAATAADLAALAAASRLPDPQRACASAEEVAAAQAARLVSCTADGLTVRRHGVRTARRPARPGLPDLTVRARAGPPSSTVEHGDRAGLVQRVVAVAALGGLHARRAAGGHSHAAIASRVARQPLGAVSKPRSANPAPPGCPS